MSIVSKGLMVVVTVGLVIGAVSVIKEKKEKLAQEKPMKTYTMLVSTMEAKKQDIKLTLPYLATIQSDNNIFISSRMSARIEKIAQCGKRVKKGELLVKLDSRELLAKKSALKLQIDTTISDIAAKENSLITAQSSHERTKELLAVKGASQEMYDKEASAIISLQAAINSMKNRVKILKTNLVEIDSAISYAIIKSPISAMVSKCYMNQGDIATPSKPILRLESQSGKYLLVRSGIKAKELVYENKIYPLVKMDNTYNGLEEYRADISSDLSTNQRVDINLIVYDGRGIKVPLGAILQKDTHTYCFIANGDKADAIEVEILAQGIEGVVVSGLQNGIKIVVSKPDILLKLLAGVGISTEED